MNDEIKEILDSLKGILDEPRGLDEMPNGNLYEYDRSYDLEQDEIKLLLDYITNLQKENEDNLKCIKSLKEQLESVINENQRLLKQWFEDNDKTVKLVSEKECYKQNFNDYKSRIEKAVEYIKTTKFLYKSHYDFKQDLLNILQNGSEDNV